MRNLKNKKRKTQRYGKYYEKIMEPICNERCTKDLKRAKKLKKDRRNLKNKKRKNPRYVKYYETIMDPIWNERWAKDLKRVKKLKKDIIKLGPIPQKEVQLIKTANYLVNLIDLITNFYDKGTLKVGPSDKKEAVHNFKFMIYTFVARDQTVSSYINKSEPGKRVTANNLYFGKFVPITDEDDINSIQTKNIDGIQMKIEVDYAPLSDWLNGRVITTNGYLAKISQKHLANYIKEMREITLKVIDELLEGE